MQERTTFGYVGTTCTRTTSSGAEQREGAAGMEVGGWVRREVRASVGRALQRGMKRIGYRILT